MRPDERANRLRAIDSRGSGEPPALKPRPPQWLIDRVLESCQGQPDAMLSAWLASRQVYPDDIAQWRAGRQPGRHWQDPRDVLRAVASLDGHPMRGHLGRMLAALVQRHAPQNSQFLPPEFATQDCK